MPPPSDLFSIVFFYSCAIRCPAHGITEVEAPQSPTEERNRAVAEQLIHDVHHHQHPAARPVRIPPSWSKHPECF